MIKLTSEEVITLTEAATRLPRLRGGKRIHLSTLYRWAQNGVRGERLETIRVGGTICTSTESLQRFCDRLSKEPKPSLSPRRLREIRRAEELADRLGI